MMSAESVTAYIGLGSNLETPLDHVITAIDELSSKPEITVNQCSSWFGSKAVGPGVQPDYVNGVAELHTTLSALKLLDTLQDIENAHGRVRTERWGARTLDLDLLWYDNQVINQPRLHVPHPRIAERNFVLFPLQELAPELILSNDKTVSLVAAEFSKMHGAAGIWKL